MAKKDEYAFEQAESWLRKAERSLEEAEAQKQKVNYSESVSACQECIEFSIKAIFLLLGVSFTKNHEIKEKEFKNLLNKLPSDLKGRYNYPRIYLISKFWSELYLTAKYGFEELKIGADNVFEKSEADLALEHAHECKIASMAVHHALRNQDG